MRTRVRWLGGVGLALTVAAALVAVRMGTANAESNGGVRVMPLGDSITDGTQVPGGYRIGLWQRLTAGRYTVDFVGSQFNGPGSLGDHDHQGHPGWRIDQIDANIVTWLRNTNPRTVLLHIGTNDVLQNFNVSGAPGRLSTLIDRITATVPDADVFVATIIPLSNAGQESAARTFNAAIPGIVQSKVNSGRRVHLVDMHAALTTADLLDGVHPNAGGYDKMAATWFRALQSVSGSIGTPGGGTSQPPTSSPPVGQPGTCTATYRVTNNWGSGFQAEVTVRNGGSTTLNGWTVRMTLAGGQTITNLWNGVNTGTSGAVSVRNAPYNGSIAGGGSTTFGYVANGTEAVPTSVTCASP
jgi:lysophospholipase L1-like esterase